MGMDGLSPLEESRPMAMGTMLNEQGELDLEEQISLSENLNRLSSAGTAPGAGLPAGLPLQPDSAKANDIEAVLNKQNIIDGLRLVVGYMPDFLLDVPDANLMLEAFAGQLIE